MKTFTKDDDNYDNDDDDIHDDGAAPRKSYSLTMFERRLIDEYHQTMHGSAVGLLLPVTQNRQEGGHHKKLFQKKKKKKKYCTVKVDQSGWN